MPTKRKHTQSVEEWALTQRTKCGVQCKGCTAPKPVQDALRLLAKMRTEGRTKVSYRDIRNMLSERFGYASSEGAILAHMRFCLKGK